MKCWDFVFYLHILSFSLVCILSVSLLLPLIKILQNFTVVVPLAILFCRIVDFDVWYEYVYGDPALLRVKIEIISPMYLSVIYCLLINYG